LIWVKAPIMRLPHRAWRRLIAVHGEKPWSEHGPKIPRGARRAISAPGSAGSRR